MTPLLLKSEKTICLYCSHRWVVHFATSTNELSSFMSGWHSYKDIQEKIRMHKLLCEQDYLEKKI